MWVEGDGLVGMGNRAGVVWVYDYYMVVWWMAGLVMVIGWEIVLLRHAVYGWYSMLA